LGSSSHKAIKLSNAIFGNAGVVPVIVSDKLRRPQVNQTVRESDPTVKPASKTTRRKKVGVKPGRDNAATQILTQGK
jgi:hypothetical protein